jgi:hypothetical protein
MECPCQFSLELVKATTWTFRAFRGWKYVKQLQGNTIMCIRDETAFFAK